MVRPAFLRNLTHRVLWTVTLAGTVALSVYWIALREPLAEWRILVLGLLLAIALGWWPLIAAITGFTLALLSWIFLPTEGGNRWQIGQEVLVFMAVGLGWGVLLRGLLQPRRAEPVRRPSTESLRHDSPMPHQAPRPYEPARHAPEAAAAPVSAPVASLPRQALPPVVPVAPAPASGFEPTTDDGIILPGLMTSSQPSSLPQRPPSASSPPSSLSPLPESVDILPESILTSPRIVPQAAPLMTQEVDLGDFRSFVASQQANSPVPSESLPVNRVAGRSLEPRPSQPSPSPVSEHSSTGLASPDEPSSVAPEATHRRSQALTRPETVPGAPYEAILEWYNQFSWAPWKPEELEKRYYRLGQKVSWDVLALQDLVRAWKVWQGGAHPAQATAGYTNLYDFEGFLRCEILGVLRSRGYPDLNLASREERSDAWMAVYRETRGRIRGGSPVLRPMPDDLVAFDAEHSLSGRPDALVDVSGECDVVAFVTPMSAGEAMAWTGVYAEAQRQLAERLGVVVTEVPIIVTLCMPIWDERRQPRLHEVEDRSTEERRLGVMLERFRKILDGSQAARPQAHGSVCNGCGQRHFCPSYAGSRPRLDLANPPPLLRKFLQ